MLIDPRMDRERVSDGRKLIGIFNLPVSEEELIFLSDLDYTDAKNKLIAAGIPRVKAKDLAWVLTCERPWDDGHTRPFLTKRCSWYRRRDQFYELAYEILTMFFTPLRY
jgi:hypothetical protein